MKYFTPERYLQLGNLQSRGAFLRGQNAWERALADYKKHLTRISPQLPSGLRRLLKSVYLHDAQVLDMWLAAPRRFTITLRPEVDVSRLAVLTYSLVEPPHVEENVLPAEARSEPVAWLYDELQIKGTTIKHDILLSNGWEVRLRFRNVSVKRPTPLIPVVDRCSEDNCLSPSTRSAS